MNKMNFQIRDDIKLIRELLSLSQEQFAQKIGVDAITVTRWETDALVPNDNNTEKIYSYAFKNNIFINEIKAQLYHEDLTNGNKIVLFHGAKSIIDGEIDIFHSRSNNDFGQGFYCGESFEQSALFVSGFEKSSVYITSFDSQNLQGVEYKVDQKWLLTIAYYRGKLKEYENSRIVKSLIKKLDNVDYIIAPIADNRMFQIIDSFINGEISDEQCKHCLAATNLGYQYVFISENSLKQLKTVERCYLCVDEKTMYQTRRLGENKIGDSKIKIARRQYRGQGQYIDEIL